MKHWKFISALLCSLFLFNGILASEFPAKPNPPRLVNDLAGLLSTAERDSLEQKLVAFDDSTSTQIAIITVTTIHGYDIDDYNARLGEQWGVGRAGKDNGVVILVAKEEREVSIATGYGVEAVLPDAISKRIIEDHIVPNFKERNFYRGLDEASTAIMQLVTGEFPAEHKSGCSTYNFVLGLLALILLIAIPVLFLAFILMFIFSGNSSTTYSGFRYESTPSKPWSWPKTSSSGSSSSSSSSSGSSSSSSRSFGGFGGGKFGGGGASGKW